MFWDTPQRRARHPGVRITAPERSLFVSRGFFSPVFARAASSPWRAGFEGRSVGVGFGSDFPEVPVFRDLPAALDFRVAPDCPPGPRFVSVAGVGAQFLVDGVADASFQAAHRFFAGLPFGLFGEVVGAAGCVVTDLTERGDVDRVVELPVAVRVQSMANLRSG